MRVKGAELVESVQIVADADRLTSRVGTALLVGLADRVGLSGALSQAMGGVRKRRSRHDPGRTLRDLAVMLADGGDCLADLRALRDQPTLWSDSYQRALAGVLTLQSDLARAIAKSLALTLLPQEQAALASRDHYQMQLTAAGRGAISTEIVAAPIFYYAEEYHQQYLAKNPGGYCGLGGTGVCYA